MPDEKTVAIRDGLYEIRYFMAGTGDPLLYLHGSGGLTWGPFLDQLAEDYAVTAPEHPGYGESSGLEHLDDMTDFALYVGDFCNAIGFWRDESPVMDYIITPPEELMPAVFSDLTSPAVLATFKPPENDEE